MFDDIRRIGEKVDDLLGTDIFPFNYPFSYTENFLQNLEKWEFAIPMKFLWLVQIDHVPATISSQNMWNTNHAGPEVSSGAVGKPGGNSRVWAIDQGKSEITKDVFMAAGNKSHGCILAQGVTLPGETYEVKDVAINNNMGFLPGKVGGNRAGNGEMSIQFRETNRSFPDLVLRPWILLASHLGLVARPYGDNRDIKTNIRIIQLAKTFQHMPLVERKIWHFYNCVPTGMDGKELTYDQNDIHLYTVKWSYTHYGVESLPDQDMSAYMNREGFKKFVKDMAHRLLSKNKFYNKLRGKLKKVERFIDKANKIKKKVTKVLGFLGGFSKPDPVIGKASDTKAIGRSVDNVFQSDSGDGPVTVDSLSKSAKGAANLADQRAAGADAIAKNNEAKRAEAAKRKAEDKARQEKARQERIDAARDKDLAKKRDAEHKKFGGIPPGAPGNP